MKNHLTPKMPRAAHWFASLGIIAALAIVGFCVTPAFAAGASVALTASSLNVPAGTTFAVGVRGNSSGVTANTIAAEVNFPSDLVQLVSVTGPSVITIPIKKGAAGSGLVSIEGGIIPAQILNNDAIGTITFKALKEGAAHFTVAASSDIYADDGHGTSLAPARGSVTVTIGAPLPPAPTPKPVPTPAPVCTPAPAPAPIAQPALVCPQSHLQTWWQNNRDLVLIGVSTALIVAGIYFIIRSLWVFHKKRKHKR